MNIFHWLFSSNSQFSKWFGYYKRATPAPVVVVPPPPPVPTSYTLPQIWVQGTDFMVENKRFRWQGVTAFRLLEMVAHGQEEQVESFLTQASSAGITVVRVLAMAYNLFKLDPNDGYAALPKLLQLAAKHGIYVELVCLADTVNYELNYLAHLSQIAACNEPSHNLIAELANEPNHPTQKPDLADAAYLKRLATIFGPTPVPVCLGASHAADDESGVYFGGAYVTVHADRTDGDNGWRWVRHCREIQAQRDGTHHKPAVNDEPRRDDLGADKHLALGALMAMWNVGDTVHLGSLLQGVWPTGDELTALQWRARGWQFVGDLVGSYGRHAQDSRTHPIDSADYSKALRIYSARRENEWIIVALGVTGALDIRWDANTHIVQSFALGGTTLYRVITL